MDDLLVSIRYLMLIFFNIGFQNTLDDHYENWHLTVHNSTLPKSKNSFRYFIEEMTWFEAVERKIPNIFIFGVAKKDEDLTTKEGAETINHRGIMRREEARVTSRVLSMTDRCKCYVGRLNDSLVKGIWANMAYELFYLTNDDDGEAQKKKSGC
ncbi:hypothetical protein BDR26DRAFT_43124 [Obelidium mucronatum]|nr:hypothetical protein BDR26DRAFT_43124 [Obelidium mucronatum]